jgi:hypothetical protein
MRTTPDRSPDQRSAPKQTARPETGRAVWVGGANAQGATEFRVLPM